MKLKTAILGYGRSGSTMHAGAIAANAEAFDLAAVCDIDPARRREAEERFGCRVWEDYHAMLAGEDLDLICIITRSDQHCAMTLDCLRAGVNVLVTKPWSLNAEEAEQMIAAWKESGKLLLPWLPARWGCDYRRLRELMAEKIIGDVFCIRRHHACFAARDDWQTERRYGGGYLLNWGPHLIEPPVLLAGGRIDHVYARTGKCINPGDGEDWFLADITMADSTLVQTEFTVAMESLPDWYIQGSRGTIVVRANELTLYKGDPANPADPTGTSAMQSSGQAAMETLEGAVYGDEKIIYAEIAQALRGEKPYPVTPDDARALSRLIDAIRLSAEKMQAVRWHV
jgi:predicted dehydrogenase